MNTINTESKDVNQKKTRKECKEREGNKVLVSKPVVALILVSSLWFLQQMIINGLTSTIISTVEKSFQLQSTESGLVVGVYDIFRAVGLVILFIPLPRLSKPTWLAISSLAMAMGSFVFSIPHFIAPEYTYRIEAIINYCGNVTESDCGVTNIRNFRYIFMCAMALVGIGSSLVIVHGLTYLDENVPKEISTFYNSIYFLAGALGPAVGYVSGGSALKLFVEISNSEVDIGTDDPQWIGAWWLLYAITSAILVVLGPVLFMLPRKLTTNWEFRNKNSEVFKYKKSAVSHQGAISNLKILLCNPTLVLSCLSNAVITSFVLGFNTFGVKYAESQLGLSTTMASYIFGGSSVLFFSLSHVTSGYILSKYKFNARRMQKYVIVCSLFSMAFTAGFFIHCSDTPFAGGNAAYGKSPLIPGNLSSTCNGFCGCSTDRYQPVVDENQVLYFSPCYAGCSMIESNGKIYTSCNCVSDDGNRTVTAYEPALNQTLCPTWKIVLFILCTGLCMFASGLSLTPLTQITLRCVHDNQRTVALGIQQLLSIVCGTVPGRILTGKVIDSSCVVWSTKCGELGSCKFYDRWEMAMYVSLLLLVEGVIIFFFNTTMYLTYRNAKEIAKVEPIQFNQA